MAAKIIDLKTLLLSAAVILAVEVCLQWVAWPKNISPVALIGAARVLEAVLLLALMQLSRPRGMAAIGLRPKTALSGFEKGPYLVSRFRPAGPAGFGYSVSFIRDQRF